MPVAVIGPVNTIAPVPAGSIVMSPLEFEIIVSALIVPCTDNVPATVEFPLTVVLPVVVISAVVNVPETEAVPVTAVAACN